MKAIPSALTAFCISSNRHHRRIFIPLRAASDDITSADSSYQPINPTQAPSSTQDKKDWFVDGKETARRLKIELGLMSDESGDAIADDNGDDDGVSSTSIEASSREDAMESGRKAALEFLKSLNDEDDDDENSTPQTVGEQTNETSETTTIDQSSSTQFTFPSRKSHCLTICLVPPPSATTAWERLSDVRRKLKDPGFYRWPPHANLLYPFVEPTFDKESDKSKEEQYAEFRQQLSISLTSVASQCKPFDIEIDTFGTFGGKDRGVLWAHPRSKYPSPAAAADYESDKEPLIALQMLLEKHFPTCTDQRKQGSFTPHMTLSHYANITDALEAKERVESEWESTTFHVPEIYVLQRKGDEGQFKILAKIPLGLEKNDDEVKLLDEPLVFPAMPIEEDEWVYNERMAMKNRRKSNFKRRRRGGRSNDDK
mmetsp:Transcript_24275/g.34749  ORF Transcript_24275/g.34749 Transcript_24275/m.34749 type:complete len:427 (+) Transcript_24275:81-1361(+)